MKSEERLNQPVDRGERPIQPGCGKRGDAHELQDERLAEAISDIKKGYDPSARFETQLMLEGLLSRLEHAGIVPIVENPNPYHPELDEAQHERWWDEHPGETEKFYRDTDKRNEVLRHLYIGALLGSGPWHIP